MKTIFRFSTPLVALAVFLLMTASTQGKESAVWRLSPAQFAIIRACLWRAP